MIVLVTAVVMAGLTLGTVFLLRGDKVAWLWCEVASLGLFALLICYVHWATAWLRKNRGKEV